MASKRDRIKIASTRWASPTSFDALLGKNPKTIDTANTPKEPSLLQISVKKAPAIPKSDIPKNDIPINAIPKINIPKPAIPVLDIPKSDTVQDLKPSAGYLSLPFSFVDSLFSSLLPSESAVFLRLYRLSRGFNRQTAETGYLTLCRKTSVSKNTAKAAILSLLEKGLISKKPLSTTNTQYTLLCESSGPVFRVSNFVFDSIFPSLKPLQQIVYLFLYRFSLGEGRSVTSPIGYTELSKALNSSINPLIDALHFLEESKYIRFESRSQQGSIYSLSIDGIPNSDIPKSGILKNGISENGKLLYQNQIHSVSDFDRPFNTTIKNNITTTRGVSEIGIPKSAIPKLDTPNKEMLLLLISKGITEKAAYSLVSKYGVERCKKGIEYSLSFSQRKETTNLPGLISHAIQCNYTTTAEQQERRKQEQLKISQQQKAERVLDILKKISEGLYITNREYDLLPDSEKEKLKYDEEHFQQHREWRYKAVCPIG